MLNPVSASEVPTISASPSTITVTIGSSAPTTITVSTPLPTFDAMIGCSNLPTGASCSTTPSALASPFSNGYQFTLTINVPSSTTPGTYSVVVQITSYNFGVGLIQPIIFGTAQTPFAQTGSGEVGPSSFGVQQILPPSPPITITVIVNPSTIPEYPLGLPSLAFLSIIVYSVIKRKTTTKKLT
jgi:hypothetical protein